jgi:hypothetical protein
MRGTRACRYFLPGATAALLRRTLPLIRRTHTAAAFTALELLEKFFPSRANNAGDGNDGSDGDGGDSDDDDDGDEEEEDDSIEAGKKGEENEEEVTPAAMDEFVELWASVPNCSAWSALWMSVARRAYGRSKAAAAHFRQRYAPLVVAKVGGAVHERAREDEAKPPPRV